MTPQYYRIVNMTPKYYRIVNRAELIAYKQLASDTAERCHKLERAIRDALEEMPPSRIAARLRKALEGAD